MLKKIVSKTLSICFGLSAMSFLLNASSYDDSSSSILGKRNREFLQANSSNESGGTKLKSMRKQVNAFSLLAKHVKEYEDELEKKDARRRCTLSARKEYLNKVNYGDKNKEIVRNNKQNQASSVRYENGRPLPQQSVFDEKTYEVFDNIPTKIFYDMLVKVFSSMAQDNSYDPNFKDSTGRLFLLDLG
jgi:hypothetical protein